MLKKGDLVKVKKVELYVSSIDKQYLDINKFTVEGVEDGKVIVITPDKQYAITFYPNELVMEDGSKLEVETNVILNKLELTDNEVDIRGMSNRDYRQLMWRCELKKQAYQSQLVTIENENNLILREIARKLGIEDIEKMIDDWHTPKERQ